MFQKLFLYVISQAALMHDLSTTGAVVLASSLEGRILDAEW